MSSSPDGPSPVSTCQKCQRSPSSCAIRGLSKPATTTTTTGATHDVDVTIHSESGKSNTESRINEMSVEHPSLRCGRTDFSIDGLLSSCGGRHGVGSNSLSTTNLSSNAGTSFDCWVTRAPGDVKLEAGRELFARIPQSPAAESSKNCGPDLGEVANFEWLQCSRYKPPKLPRRREFPRRRHLGRNPRIPFTSVQVSALEAQFAVTRYLSGAQVHSIAVALGLTDTRVKIWFQNRRAREKRERQPYHLTEHGSTTAQSAALGASLAAETVRLAPTMGFDLSRPLHERLHSPTVLAPSGLETVSTRQVSLNRSGTNFFPPFGYWPALPVLQWSSQASDSLP